MVSYKHILGLIGLMWLLAPEVHAQYDEKYRPQYHFSPQEGWIGDPDGLVYSEGKYHLFWWGHAVSEDLVHWEELPHPMKGDDGSFSYFSGSVVVDHDNTAGFGKGSMLAFYTQHYPGDSLPESQAISVSKDGLYFDYYENNPVLDIEEIFFRDPQVFWYEPQQKWVMAVSLPDKQLIQLYESKDLKSWAFMSDFGPLGAQNSFWECPDLMELPVGGEPGVKKWVMFIGRGPNRVQYFVGSFDGFQFIPDEDMLSYLNEGKGLEGELFEGFDRPDFQDWEVSGTAFGAHPVQNGPFAGLGKGYVQSDHKMPGSLLSSEFIIRKPAINFLLAGNKRPGQLGVRLIVDGETVKTATGDNTDVFRWRGWDVSELIGKTARMAIVDSLSGEEEEFIAVDHILFSDQLMDLHLEHALWMDYGPDFYAARTWRDVDQVRDGRTTMLGWMGNWEYARIVPTSWGKGFESVPRDISLRKLKNGYRLVQQPIPELQKLRKEKYEESDRVVEGIQSLASFLPARNCYELEAVWNVDQSTSEFGLNLLVGEGRKLSLTYDPVQFNLVLDRTNCTDYTSDKEFNQKFPSKMSMVVQPENGQLRLHILVDQSSVEVFTNQGEKVMSALTFPGEDQKGIELFASEGKALLVSLKAWELHSIWNKP